MLIFDEPYISELAIKTARENNFELLETDFLLKQDNVNELNIFDSEAAVNLMKGNEFPLVYTNSENSINWICKNLQFTQLPKYINLFKDKNKFRELLKSIYPDFYFKEIEYSKLKDFDISTVKMPFIIKPTVGFLSMGVYLVKTESEWRDVLSSLANDMQNCQGIFPVEVMDSSKFIIEEYIDGEEYAIDAYFNQDSEPLILNIFQHPFVNESDVSDRAYITSKKIIQDNLERFEQLLVKIGNLAGLKNFPMHIEVRVSKNGNIIPIEVNPLRFAGWHTTDLAYYAYGINVYEYFIKQRKPDWNRILSNKSNEIYYFMMAEVPSDIDKNSISGFNYEGLKNRFSKTLEFRQVDWKNRPLFAMSFGEVKNYSEITEILNFDVKEFIIEKEVESCK